MSLFGFSPGKKLERARGLLAEGRDYEARQAFEELLERRDRLAPEQVTEAASGVRTARLRMIQSRLEEAEALQRSGDLEGAKDRCLTALDLAGEDMDTSEIQEKLRQLEAPRRPTPRTTRLEDAVQTDLLPPAESPPKVTPVDRPAVPKAPPKTDAELFGEDPDLLFELQLNALEPDTALYYRTLGPDFRFGYLALVQGEGTRALDFFTRLPESESSDPRVILERAHAHLLAGDAEAALSAQEAASSAGLGDAALDGGAFKQRAGFLRIEILRSLGRLEEAVLAAKSFVEDSRGPSLAAESLLAWTLLEAGKAEEASELLEGWLSRGEMSEEILVPAAQAAAALGKEEEAIGLLEGLLQMRFHRSLQREVEVDFPVEAGRRLLQLYLDAGRDLQVTRTLVLHLLDYDPERGEVYRDLLLRLGTR